VEAGLNAICGVLGVSLVSAGAVGTAITVLSDWAVRRWQKRERRGGNDGHEFSTPVGTESRPLPAISVLRPVKGVDVGLQENFEVLVSQQYPEFEVLVGAESPDDPAVMIARRVARASRVPVRVVICPHQTGLNPKVSILEALAKEARHDAVLISDSNVRVRPGYLENLGRRLSAPKVGIVTNIVLGEAPGTLAAVLEILQLITFVARATFFARYFVGHACVVGKSMLFRMSDWNRLGGFARVRNVLAEDYVMGHLFSEAGLQVALAPDPVPVPLQQWSFGQLFNRHLRWAQMRRRVSLSAFALEPLLYPAPLLILGIAFCALLGIVSMAKVGLTCLVLRFLCDARLIAAINDGRSAWWWCLVAPAKDCFALVIWAIGGLKRTLTWRGNRLVICEGSRLEREGTDIDLAVEAS
jgi:ceramide glucosyltransferase